MIRYQDEDFLFSASSIEATFSESTSYQLNNKTVHQYSSSPIHQLNNVTVRSSTPLGDQLVLADGDSDRVVRLILISPDRDWRRAQTYAWKLDNAWMSDPDSDWLHWNVESYVDSAIQVPQDNNIFACARLEFHFSPIGLQHWVTSTKVVLRDVRIGAHLSSSKLPQTTYRPCAAAGDCSVVDGAVVGATRGDEAFWKSGAAIGAILLFLLSIGCWCRRRRRVELYEQLSPTPEEDLTLAVDDTYQSTAPRSTMQGVANETG